jgi:tetratricopeptide (TPR) repeat protein
MGEAADFFISYTGADRAWAEWVAWQLEDANYRTILQAWDFEPGDNFVVRMQDALEEADRTLALVSKAYLASPYCTDEWTGAFLHDDDGRNHLLLVRIEDCKLPRLLRTQSYIDLVGLPGQQARTRLLAEVGPGRRKPTREPAFPKEQAEDVAPRFPGHGPEITNVPPRNPEFSGRGALLEELHKRLTAGGTAAVAQAATVHGLGGVGKTQLALEYAHRYATHYDVIWWVPAEQPVAIPGVLAELARRLQVPEQADQAELLTALWDTLRKRDRWLLIYDNADRPKEIADYRPPRGSGRQLITSRTAAWGRPETTLRLDVLDRGEAVTFLRRRTASDDTATLAQLADALGDLPLALEQAAAYMDRTHTTPADYLALYREHAAELLALGEPLTTEQTVATTWQVSLDRLRSTPAAKDLLSLCAFLAPDSIPRSLLVEHATVLPEPLREAVEQSLARNEVIHELDRYSLVTVTAETMTVHRLVQTVVRASLDDEGRRQWADVAFRLVAAAFPLDSADVANWPTCALLLPHALAAVGYAAEFGVEPEASALAELLNKEALYLWSHGQYRQARALQERALAIRQNVLGKNHRDTLTSMYNLAEILRALGDLQGAHDLHEQTLKARKRFLGEDDHDTLRSMHSLAVTHRQRGNPEAARQLFEQTLKAHRQVLGDDHRDTLRTMNDLAETHRNLGNLRGALELFEQILNARRRVLGDDHPETFWTMNGLGEIRRALGDLQGALSLHEQTVAGYQKLLRDDHPDTLVAVNSLAVTLQSLGNLHGAFELHQQNLIARRRVLGDDHPDTLWTKNNLADTRRALGDLPGALALHKQTLATRKRVLGHDHPNTLISMSNLGETLRILGDIRGAFRLHEQVLVTRRQVLGDDHPDTFWSMHRLAMTLRNLGHLRDARELFEQTMTTRKRVLGHEHPDTLQSMHSLAAILRDLRDLEEAHRLFGQTLKARQQVLGEDHPDILWTMHGLAETHRNSGALDAARVLHVQTLKCRRQVLGRRHPDTLRSMNSLAMTRRAVGDLQRAHRLFGQTLKARQQVLGEDHPDILWTMHGLAETHRALARRELEHARDLHKQTLRARRRVLGDDHPDTRTSRSNLAAVRRKLRKL